MLTYFRARTKDFGANIQMAEAAVSATASATATFGVIAVSDVADTAVAPGHTAYIDELFISTLQAITGGAAITLNVKKYNAAGAAAVTIVTGYDLTALVIGKAKRIPIPSSITDSQRTMHFGDTLYIEVVAAGTVTANFLGGIFTAKIKLVT